jgi:D-apiose dehydrogenase
MEVTPMPRRRCALVGCGFFAANHLHAWDELRDRVELAAVCDLDEAKAASAQKRFGVPAAYTDVAEMLRREALDFVDVATTAPSHRSVVEACAGAGLAAIVQKPLAPSWEEAVAIVTAMSKAGRPLMVHENFRFQAPIKRASELFRAGCIGEAEWGRFSFRTGFDIYANQPYLGEVERFIILDLGIHVLDVARVFMGEVESVFCQTQSIRPGIRGEDAATMMLRHANGATSIVDISYASRQTPDPFPQTLIHLEGARGSIRLDYGFRLTVTTPAGAQSELVPPAPRVWTQEPWVLTQDSVVSIQRHWLDCLDNGVETSTSGFDNLKTFALVEAAYRSAASGLLVMPEKGPLQ